MLAILLQALLFASSGMLSVGSITLVILLLISDRGWKNGLSYSLGYTSSYTLIGLIALTFDIRSRESESDLPGMVFSILLIILGTLLLWLSFRNRRKPRNEERKQPRFFDMVDSIIPVKAFGFGMLVPVINIKNLALFLTAMSVIIMSDLITAYKIITTLLVAAVFCFSVIIPVFIYLLFPQRAVRVLNNIKNFISTHSRAIGIGGPLIFGCLFLLRGIRGLM